MRCSLPVSLLAYLVLGAALLCAERSTLNFNPDWRFIKADPAGAQGPGFDDSAWQVVSAPHTFNDVDTFDNWSLPGHRGEQEQWSGRTWYRKTFTAPEAWRGKRVFIEFEAVRQIAEVYLNNTKLGEAKSGFTPFGFDLTPQLRFDGPNVIAVMVDNRFMRDPLDPKLAPQAATTAATHPNLGQLSAKFNETIPATVAELQADQIPWNNPHWHPAHGGIYRNVRLHITDPLQITLPLYSFLQTEGPYAYATKVSTESARLGVEVPVRNGRATGERVSLDVEVFDADGRSVFKSARNLSLSSGEYRKFVVTTLLAKPRLWEPGYPHVYRVAIALSSEGRVIDSTEIPLGIRAVRWDAASGLWLNGFHYKLHGWGQKATNEWPGLGAAQPDWMHALTLQLMKEAGGNFVRWGHVAGGPAQIAAADQLGIVMLQPGVDGESDTVGGAWALRSATFRDVIIYYRNHPSILIWEGGNQKVSRAHAAELRGHMDRYDPQGGRAYAHRRADPVTAEFMDVGIGTEGGREIARLPVVEGEYNREESPRRVWDDASPPKFGYPEAKGQTYQLTSEQFAVNEVAHYVNKLGSPAHAGGANWIFSDTTSGGRVGVEVARGSGEVDGVRLPKEAYYVCQVMFSYEPRVHLVGHWSYPANTKKTVYVVSNTGGPVELFLNGRSLGRSMPEKRFLYTFKDVAFEPGELKAVAVAGDGSGAALVSHVLRTVGGAVALRLSPIVGPGGWRADGADVALFDVEAVDAAGNRVPTYQQRVDFEFKGPASWRGGYNSGKIDSINNPYLDLEAGINRVAVRSSTTPGAFTLTVRARGLREATSTIASLASDGAPPAWPRFALPEKPLRQPQPEAAAKAVVVPKPGQAGRYIKAFNYSGPEAALVHVEIDARTGRNAYVDIDSPFGGLAQAVLGADWIQASNRDALYHAVDLMELTVVAGAELNIAHDDRLPRPPWLVKDYTPSGLRHTQGGVPMSVFTRKLKKETSLTLGPNTEDSSVKVANMYLVFVTGPSSVP
jgi:beta-galactosidase